MIGPGGPDRNEWCAEERKDMNGRGWFRALAVVALVAVVVAIGVGVYNAGVGTGLAEAARQAAVSGEPVTVVPGYGYGYGWGPGHGWGFFPFGILFWILGIFLIFGLVRAAFGGGRRWGGGPGGHGGPGGSHDDYRRQRFDEWHRRSHEDPAAGA